MRMREEEMYSEREPLPDPPIEMKGIWKSYGKKTALAGFDLTVKKGEVVALLGRNGAGKTTAIRILLGQLAVDRGTATLCGHDTEKMPPLLRRRVGYMAEGNHLDPWETVRGIVEFTRAFYPRWNGTATQRLLERFKLGPTQKIGQLSNGQRGQLALVLALGPDPDVLVLDDPMLGLDAVVRSEFFENIADVLSSREISVLFTSHILPDVERIADRIVIQMDGRVAAIGSLEELAARYRRFHVRLADGAAPPARMPGMISIMNEGRGYAVVTADAEPLRALKPESMEEDPMNLEEIFVAVTSGVAEERRA